MRTSLVLGMICLAVATAAAAETPSMERVVALLQAGQEPVRVVCFGDSITAGSGVDNPTTNAYPIVLGKLLGTNYQTRNFGVSGRTLLKRGDFPYWNEQAFRNATNYLPHIVTIKLGTNDSKPQNWRYKDQFAADLRAMVDLFANLPSHPQVYLCLPVPAYATAYDINSSGEIVAAAQLDPDPFAFWPSFLLRNGSLTLLPDYPGVMRTFYAGLNNKGDLVGVWFNEDFILHGFDFA